MSSAVAILVISTNALCQEPGDLQSPTASTESKSENEAAEEVPRDPFWPVGYRPKAANEDDGGLLPKVKTIKWPSLNLKSIARASGGTHVAILEGVGIVEVGDIVTVKKDGLIFKWRIEAITEKGILPRRLGVRGALRSGK